REVRHEFEFQAGRNVGHKTAIIHSRVEPGGESRLSVIKRGNPVEATICNGAAAAQQSCQSELRSGEEVSTAGLTSAWPMGMGAASLWILERDKDVHDRVCRVITLEKPRSGRDDREWITRPPSCKGWLGFLEQVALR